MSPGPEASPCFACSRPSGAFTSPSRAFGAVMFGLPLFMTMEVWWLRFDQAAWMVPFRAINDGQARRRSLSSGRSWSSRMVGRENAAK